LHDDANYGLSFPFRGNLTSSTTAGAIACLLVGPNGESYMYAPDNKRIAKTLTGAQGAQWFLWVGGMRVGTYTHNYNSSTDSGT
jgi:hypothetical protein